MKNLIAVVSVVILAATLPARAEPIDPFVGQWTGSGITENGAPAESIGLIDRDINVIVETVTDGFNVTWSTVRPATGTQADKTKVSTISVTFVEIDKPGIYRMAESQEPISGSPYIWARVIDHRLEVHSITISERGVLEYQKYVRTLLSDDEMQLRFTRSLDGSIVRTVLAHLARQ